MTVGKTTLKLKPFLLTNPIKKPKRLLMKLLKLQSKKPRLKFLRISIALRTVTKVNMTVTKVCGHLRLQTANDQQLLVVTKLH